MTVLLCDSAQAVGGKLYILGGGWSRVMAINPNISMVLAVHMRIPWAEANRRLTVRFDLVTEDGQSVPAPNGDGVYAEAKVEVGRPPGLRPGTDLDQTFVIPAVVPLRAGVYRWDVSVDGEKLEDVAFEVVAPPPEVTFLPGGRPNPS
ncbi:MAG TPA: hypothetical protein VF134_03445 [Candidatus Dormibacteraeota bacterium]